MISKIPSALFVLCLVACQGPETQRQSKPDKVEPPTTTTTDTTTHEVLPLGPLVPMLYPVHITVAEDGTVFVGDHQQGTVLGYRERERVVQLEGIEEPLGLAVRDGRLYVGSAADGRVDVYDIESRTHLLAFGEGDGEFQQPNNIALSDDGTRVYVVDSAADLVGVYTSSGERLSTFGQPGEADGQFQFPIGIDVDATRVVVGDQGNNRVQLFDLDGQYISQFGQPMADAPESMDDLQVRFSRIQGVALLGDNIAVLDSTFGHVQLVDGLGAHVGYVGARGSCGECVALSLDVAATPFGGLVVTDPERRRWTSLSMNVRSLP